MKPNKSSSPGPDATRIDVQRLAADAGTLQGALPLGALPRLQDAMFQPDDGPAGGPPVRWSAEAGLRRVAGSGAQPWLRLQAQAEVTLQCQRCLQPMPVPVEVDRRFRFVGSEEEAEAQDLDSEDEVLALPPLLDLPALVEDELILAMPLVPRHEQCEPPAPLEDPLAAQELAEARPNPFAALEVLKRGPQGRH